MTTLRVEDTRVSSSPYCSSLMLGLKASPCTERPQRILVDTTYLLCEVTRLEARLVLGTAYLGIQVIKLRGVAEITRRMDVSALEASVVLLCDNISNEKLDISGD